MLPKLVFKNKDVLVFNKPAGLPVHKGIGTQKTLIDFIIKSYPEVKKVGNPQRPGIVHRLDKDTSGILIVARSKGAFKHLKREFKERRVKKIYLALVHGRVKKDRDIIAKKIGRSRQNFKKRAVLGSAAREAITRFEVIKRFTPAPTSAKRQKLVRGYTLLKVMPETGRQHQIRIHLTSYGHPIAGDKVYKFKRQKHLPGLKRQFLHASELTIKLPDGKTKTFKAKLPKDLKNALKSLS